MDEVVVGLELLFFIKNLQGCMMHKVDAFEVREMGALMFDLDLKGCKFHGRAFLNFGLI